MRQFSISRFSIRGTLQNAAPSYLVPGARRFGLSRFSCPGTLQSRPVSIDGAAGGYLAGKSYALPDVSGGVSISFEEI